MEEMRLLNELRELQRHGKIAEALKILSENPGIEFSDNDGLRIIAGIIHGLSGDLQKASEMLATINAASIEDPETTADLGLLIFLCRDPEASVEVLQRAFNKAPDSFIINARLSSIYLLLDRLDEAEKHLMKALEIEPDRVELIANLSSLKLKQGKIEEAVEVLNRALELDPARRELYVKKSNLMTLLERDEEFIEELYDRIRENPEDKDRYIILAHMLLEKGRENEAVSVIEAALDKFEDDEDVRLAFVRIGLNAQRYYVVGTKLKEWTEQKPDSMELRYLLNKARIEVGFLDAAEEDLEAFPDEEKSTPEWKLLRAKVFVERNNAQEAIRLLEEVVEQFPGHAEARSELSHLLLSVGRKEEAKAHAEALAEINPFASIQLVRHRDYKAEEEEIEALEKILDNILAPLEQRITVGFTLAETYEKARNFDKAFETVIKANELTRTITRYDWKEHRRYVQDIMAAFDEETIRRLEGKGHPSERPIFIVGMPRSGTTLVEQILASHSQVYGAGELPWIGRITALFPRTNGGYPYPQGIRYMDERHMKSAGEYYLEKLNIYNKTSPRVTDKLPHNFDHVGLIHLIFPNARIIHAHRDPRDVAVSNYFQNFAAMRGTMGFANDLKDIGHMLNDYLKIMDHWYRVLPEGRIFKVVYEELVSEPERLIRELLDYCELPWEENVLKFYETQRPVRTASIDQVRKEIYQESKGKWARYARYLTPLMTVLEEGFVPVE